MKLTVNVTADCIKYGEPGSPWKCPVAKALDIVDPRRRHVVAGGQAQGQSVLPGQSWSFRLPNDVMTRIMRYDEARVMEPFTFELETEVGSCSFL